MRFHPDARDLTERGTARPALLCFIVGLSGGRAPELVGNSRASGCQVLASAGAEGAAKPHE